MESSQTPETGRGVQLPDNSEAENAGSSQIGVHEGNNLFFCKDDGEILAVCISPNLGPTLLRGLSKPDHPLCHVFETPFELTPSTAVDDDLAGDAQIQDSTANVSAQPSSTASDANRAADVSSSKSAPESHASTALPGTLHPNPVNVDDWVDKIFPSADGDAYNRDWMSIHNVNNDILGGVPSKHKLNVLVKQRAVYIDDKLCVTYNSSGNPTVIEGEILPVSTNTDLCVRIAPAGEYSGKILRGVQGPRELISEMDKKYAKRYKHEVSEWKAVRVVSSTGKDAGTLFEVRQAYQVWTNEKAKWEARKARAASG